MRGPFLTPFPTRPTPVPPRCRIAVATRLANSVRRNASAKPSPGGADEKSPAGSSSEERGGIKCRSGKGGSYVRLQYLTGCHVIEGIDVGVSNAVGEVGPIGQDPS
jgi:hypothetical protein